MFLSSKSRWGSNSEKRFFPLSYVKIPEEFNSDQFEIFIRSFLTRQNKTRGH